MREGPLNEATYDHLEVQGILQDLIYILITFYLTFVFCWFSNLIEACGKGFKQCKTEQKMSYRLTSNTQFHTPKLPLPTIFYLSFQKISVHLKYKLYFIAHIVFTSCINIYRFPLVFLTTCILLNRYIKIYLTTLVSDGAEKKGMIFNARNNQDF